MTHICEAMIIVVCFVDDNWHLQQQVVRLMLLATKSRTGEELARWTRQFTRSPKTRLASKKVQICWSLHTRPLHGGQNVKS